MFFHLLSKKEQEAVKALTVDAEFQKRFREDSVLDALEEEKYDEVQAVDDILLLSGRRPRNAIGFLTIYEVAMLWALKWPMLFTKKNTRITVDDLDIFFYILNEEEVSPATVRKDSLGACERLGLSYPQAAEEAMKLLNEAFRPLKMFPAMGEGGRGVDFDNDWAASMTACVHQMTGLEPSFIINKMPLSSVLLFFIQYCRSQGKKGIQKRTEKEVIQAMSERTDELITDYFIEKHILKPSQREVFINRLRTPPT